MIRLLYLLLLVAVLSQAAVDRRPDRRDHHTGHRHHRDHRHRNEHHRRTGHHGHNHRQQNENVNSQDVGPSLGLGGIDTSWLPIAPLEPLEHTLDWTMEMFGAGPWWKGPNVCENRLESSENLTTDGDNIDGVPITHHHFYTKSACEETAKAYKCTTIINVGPVKKTVTVTLECCHGYDRAKGESGCPTVVPLEPIPDTLRRVGAGELVRGFESTGLNALLNEGNFTIFAPKDVAFQAILLQTDVSSQDKVVVITPEIKEVVNNIEDMLMAHVVPGMMKTGVFSDELILHTSYPVADIRINVYDNPKQILTANCVPIEKSDQMATNGVIHVTEGILPIAEYSVADIVSKNPDLSRLKKMLGKLGVVQTLREEGQYTLFAPTNAAFDNIKPSLLNKLLNGGSCLGTLVRTHLLPNVICSSIIIGKVKTINILGHFVNLTRDENDKLWMGHAQVIRKDIMASNGVVHLIDNVITPDSVLDVLQVAEKVGATSFVKLVSEVGLNKDIESHGNITLFLPSNEAIGKLSPKQISSLKSDREALTGLIKYHLTPGLIRADSIQHSRSFKTLNANKSIAVREFYSSPFGMRRISTVQCAPISHKNLETCNGIVHIIDKVMIPPKGNVLDTISHNANLSMTYSLIKKAGLSESLQAEGPFTVLAPTNDAWNALGQDILGKMTSDQNILQAFLKHHVTAGTICCSGIFHARFIYKQRERMLDSSTIGFNKRHERYVIGRNTTVTQCDLAADNGVVHVIGNVLPEAMAKYVNWRPEIQVEDSEEGEPGRLERMIDEMRRHQGQMMGGVRVRWDSFMDSMRDRMEGLQQWHDNHGWGTGLDWSFRLGSKKK